MSTIPILDNGETVSELGDQTLYEDNKDTSETDTTPIHPASDSSGSKSSRSQV